MSMRRWWIRGWGSLRRWVHEGELHAEIESNLDLQIDENLRSGMSPDEARRAALVRFGSVEATKEAWRDQKRLPVLEVLMNDSRYALRLLRKSPLFAATVILVLALGIGGNVAIFSIVNAALLRPLPYNEPSELVLLWGNVQRAQLERRGASVPDYLNWGEQNKSFEGVAAYWSNTFTMTGAEERRAIAAEVVGAKYFNLLGVKPIIGRDFLPEEELRPGSAPVVILGHSFWNDELGADPAVLGTRIELDGQPFTIIGVMPRGFLGLTDQAGLFVPPGVLPNAQQLFAARGNRWFAAVARLRPGVTLNQAQAEMNSISLGLQAAFPGTNDKRGVEVAPLINETFGSVRPALLTLLAAVGMVLLIACANVANLLLVRTETRHSEIAVRTALGAGRREVLQLLLTESFVLSAIGTVLGGFLAMWAVQLILTASPIQLPSFVNVHMDGQVILFAIGLAVVTAVFMGLAPALQGGPTNLSDTLKSSSTKTTGSVSRRRFRNGLVVAEVALTFVLLAGAGLFIESFRRLSQVDPGFRTDHLLTARITAPRDARLNVRVLRETLAAIPGVESVTAATDIPFTGSNAIFYTAEGQPAVDATNVPRAYVHRVADGYFHTMNIALVAGREFNEAEPETSVIVSENVIKRFWPGQDPIGKRVKSGNVTSAVPWLNIVGVVRETKTRNLPNNPTADPDLYFPFVAQPPAAGVLIRTAVEPSAIITSVRSEIRRLEKLALVSNISTMDDLIQPLTARSRFTTWLTGVFSIIALILTLVGIYGTMSYTIAQRTREIGIRIALGATTREVFRTVLGRALALIGGGLVAGIAAALIAGRGIDGLLFGVRATDPAVFLVVSLFVLLTGTLAAVFPARRR
jgi:predicted permease